MLKGCPSEILKILAHMALLYAVLMILHNPICNTLQFEYYIRYATYNIKQNPMKMNNT